MPTPHLDQNLRLAQRVEDFPIQELVSELPIEALDVTILLRASGGDVPGLHIYTIKPITHRMGGELAALVPVRAGKIHLPAIRTPHRCAGSAGVDLVTLARLRR